MSILLALVVLSVIVYRPYCRHLCPLGAVYGFFAPVTRYRFEINGNRCTKCRVCQKACPLDIRYTACPTARSASVAASVWGSPPWLSHKKWVESF